MNKVTKRSKNKPRIKNTIALLRDQQECNNRFKTNRYEE